jgi:hypothetical protein
VKKFIKNVLLVTVPSLLFCLLIAEFIVFRFFIPACEPPLYSFDEQFKLLHLKPQTSGQFTAGRFAQVRGRWRSNNCGWNSEIDYVPGIGKKRPLVAVIGDSYVEAFQVDVDQRFPALLQKLMGDDSLVYSFGISGAALSQYLHISRYVNQVFHPQILVINVVHNDFDESLATLGRVPKFLQIAWQNGAFVEIPPEPFQHSTFSRICRWSAVIRYLEMNCDFYHLIKNISRQLHPPPKPPIYNANIDVEAVTRERDLIRQGIRYMVAKIRAENADKRVIIQMDGPRFDIYPNNLANSNVWWMHEILRDACRESRIEFLDLTEPFRRHFEKHRQNFENAQVGEAHWNKLGHEVVARALWDQLNGTGTPAQASPANR